MDLQFLFGEPSSKRAKLGHNLFKQLEAGELVDVAFLVGPQKSKIPAHKIILTATSDVFAAKLCNPGRWDNQDTIELPEHISETSVRLFLTYVYKEELKFEKETDVDTVLDVISLAHLFLMKDLFTLCERPLQNRINIDNCVRIYLETKAFEASSSISKLALKYIKENVVNVLTKVCVTEWSPNGLLDLLQADYLQIEEIELFKYLLKWKAITHPTEESFQRLISHIRFPLMGAQILADEIAPTGELSDKDLISLFIYFDGQKNIPTRFSHEARKVRIASNARQLKDLISTASPGDIIQLEEKEYKGKFIINTTLTIRGIGEKTILSGIGNSAGIATLDITGNNFRLSNCTVEFISSGIIATGLYGNFKNIKLVRHQHNPDDIVNPKPVGFCVVGSCNTLDGISVESNNTGVGISLLGDYNNCRNCSFDGLEAGIVVDAASNKCSLKSMTCTETQMGVKVDGKLCEVDGVDYHRPNGWEKRPNTTAVIVYGRNATVKNVICEGYTTGDKDWGLILETTAENCEARDCKNCSSVVRGANHKLINVNCGDLIHISGRGHHLENCKAKICRIRSKEGVSIVGCNFSLPTTMSWF